MNSSQSQPIQEQETKKAPKQTQDQIKPQEIQEIQPQIFQNDLIQQNLLGMQDNSAQSILISQIIMNHQQNLINQLLLAQKLQEQAQNQDGNLQTDINQQQDGSLSNDDDDDQNSQSEKKNSKKTQKQILRKRIKKENNCGHADKEHYAKGMCSNCYHKYGRTKKPWNCSHGKLYAVGLCQNCYINKYNHTKRSEFKNIADEDIKDSQEGIQQQQDLNEEQQIQYKEKIEDEN